MGFGNTLRRGKGSGHDSPGAGFGPSNAYPRRTSPTCGMVPAFAPAALHLLPREASAASSGVDQFCECHPGSPDAALVAASVRCCLRPDSPRPNCRGPRTDPALWNAGRTQLPPCPGPARTRTHYPLPSRSTQRPVQLTGNQQVVETTCFAYFANPSYRPKIYHSAPHTFPGPRSAGRASRTVDTHL